MNRIVTKKNLSEDLVKFEISSSIPVNTIQPGQYIVIRRRKNDPGLAVPVVKTNSEKQTLTVILSVSEASTGEWPDGQVGSTDFEIEGPFGDPVSIKNYGTVLCIGRGSGILPLLPVMIALRAAGNQVISILSASSKEEIILQNDINVLSDQVMILTDDGSDGEKASLCQAVGQSLRNHRVNQVIVMGGAKTIREIFSITAKHLLQTQAVLYRGEKIQNGLHGIFRVKICGDVRSVCVDGYNFNAWYPNFEELLQRFPEAGPAPKVDRKVMARAVVPL